MCIGSTAIGQNNSDTLTNKTPEVGTMIMVSDNSVKGMSSVCTEEELRLDEILRSNDINWVLDEGVEYGNTLKCLIKYESQFNPNATGDRGLAFGILQFWRSTFDQYSKKFNLKLDYKNPVHQIVLADLMLQSDYNEITHWSPWRKCYGR